MFTITDSSSLTPFTQALIRSVPTKQLFSTSEKRTLAVMCAVVFVLPLLGSRVLLQHSLTTTLSLAPASPTFLPQTLHAPHDGTDELAMATYFMDKASTTTGAQSADLLSQAQALLLATTQTGAPVTLLKNRLVSLTNSESATVQRVAAPLAPDSQVLAGTTSSNATGTTLHLPAGTTTMTVPAPAITDETQIYLSPIDNRDNDVIYVQSKKAGVGFTLASLTPLPHDVSITWYAIKTP